jgi:tellurite resistance protein
VTCALIWAGFTIVYAAQRFRLPKAFSKDLRHPVFGPFAANIPLIGVLLSTHFGQYFPDAAPWVVWVFVASSLLVAAQLFTHWLAGGLPIEYLHPGYFLPVVAAAFVGSIGLSSVGSRDGAIAAFGIGVFFWLVVGTIVTGRLITTGALPQILTPTLSVLLVPPAVGGLAWLVLQGGRADAVGLGFIGVLCILFLVQVLLIPQYAALPVSISLWTFSFPVAAAANYLLRWLYASPFPGSVGISWAIISTATAFISGLAVLMLLPLLRRRSSTPASATAELPITEGPPQ